MTARLVTTARRHILKIDPTRPWARDITTAYTRLTALPAPNPATRTPTNQDPGHRPPPTARPGTTHAITTPNPPATSTTHPQDRFAIMMKKQAELEFAASGRSNPFRVYA
ncbi:MAG: hypothetical protein JO100_11990 [Pseudonocardia sp.]|jgi:hypothetical protein|nr:hypothetical protein [Pseudonocardia sp.]